MNAMQPSLTDMPQNVIRHITGFIIKKHDRKILASTCRYLHASVTRENKTIIMHCSDKRGNLSAKQFLNQVFTCIQHIVVRGGNNPIRLHLNWNNLDDDINAVSTFFAQCSQPQIARHIKTLQLGGNNLSFLPKEIRGLIALKNLNLFNNRLTVTDLYRLKRIIKKSLIKLKTVNISDNLITTHEIFQTIAHCKLKMITTRKAEEERYRLYEPTNEEELACKTKKIAFLPPCRPVIGPGLVAQFEGLL